MDNKFIMSLSLNVLNHLGINLYSNIPAVLSELLQIHGMQMQQELILQYLMMKL